MKTGYVLAILAVVLGGGILLYANWDKWFKKTDLTKNKLINAAKPGEGSSGGHSLTEAAVKNLDVAKKPIVFERGQ